MEHTSVLATSVQTIGSHDWLQPRKLNQRLLAELSVKHVAVVAEDESDGVLRRRFESFISKNRDQLRRGYRSLPPAVAHDPRGIVSILDLRHWLFPRAIPSASDSIDLSLTPLDAIRESVFFKRLAETGNSPNWRFFHSLSHRFEQLNGGGVALYV